MRRRAEINAFFANRIDVRRFAQKHLRVFSDGSGTPAQTGRQFLREKANQVAT